MNRFSFNPESGFLDSSRFPNPQNENDTRTQLQTLHNQVRDFVNSEIKPAIDELQTNELQSIVSSDGSVSVSKDGKTLDLKVSIAGGGATIGYVDMKAQNAEANAKNYADQGLNILDNQLNTAKFNITNLQSDQVRLSNYIESIDGRLHGISFVALTQAQYDALATKDPNTVYFVTEN